VLRLEIVKRSDDLKGFILLPHRCVVERTFSRLGRNRRIAVFITLAWIAIRRLAR
jgi:transposase